MALLQQGNRSRTTEPTRANETSSRSHAILQVNFEVFEEKNEQSLKCHVCDMLNLLHLGCG